MEKEINNDRLRIGQAVAGIRQEKGLSQAALADLAGLPVLAIKRLENGQISTSIDKINQVLAAMGARLDIVV